MTREELYTYIQTSKRLGKTVEARAILDYDPWPPNKILEQSVYGSVEFRNMYFKIDSHDNIVLTYYHGKYAYLDLGTFVDIIGPLSFCENTTIKGIKSKSVKRIEKCAFEDSTLKHAQFNSVKIILHDAFKGAEIEFIDAPELETVNAYAFWCSEHLKNINAPKLKNVTPKTFFGCNNLSKEFTDALARSTGVDVARHIHR